ncbi:MAG TPA: response regulator [Terriglobales bacterium]|nr:response regulator [Terriglobales bacterium]
MTKEAPERVLGTVLLAEDEPLLRELGETILRQAGYTVVSVANGDEMRKLMADHSGGVDLLLTDVVMPDMSGPDLARLGKQRWPDARILYMSGYADEELKDLDPNAGFIQKPFTPTELMAKIAEMLARPSQK